MGRKKDVTPKGRALSSAETKKYAALFKAARDGWDHAYAPYSKFHVGSAIIDETGRIFGGCNVENASYGGSVCAERVAILKAKSEGSREIQAISVVTNQKSLIPPCALCLQVMAEFARADTPVLLGDLSGPKRIFLFQELLSYPFGPGYLKAHPRKK